MTRSVVELVERVDELETQADRDLRSGGTTSESLSAILDRADELLHQQPQRAERLARWCDARSEGPGLLGLRARSRYQQAQIAAERGELDAALDLIAEARALWAEAADPVASLRTDLGRMHVLDDLGRAPRGDRGRRAADRGAGPVPGRRPRRRPAAADPGPRRQEPRRRLRACRLPHRGVGRLRARRDRLPRPSACPRRRRSPLANRGVELLALGQPPRRWRTSTGPSRSSPRGTTGVRGPVPGRRGPGAPSAR